MINDDIYENWWWVGFFDRTTDQVVALGEDTAQAIGGPAGGFDFDRYDKNPDDFFARWYMPGPYVCDLNVADGEAVVYPYDSYGPDLGRGEGYAKDQELEKEIEIKADVKYEEKGGKKDKKAFGGGEQVDDALIIAGLEGSSYVRRPEDGEWIKAEVGMPISKGRALLTGKGSTADLELTLDEVKVGIKAGENTQLLLLKHTVDKTTGEQLILVDLASGKLDINVERMNKEKTKFYVKTPSYVLSVKHGSISLNVKPKKASSK